VLIGGVVPGGVTRPVGHHGAAPDRPQDVHVRRAGLVDVGWASSRGANGGEESGGQRRALARAIGDFVAAGGHTGVARERSQPRLQRLAVQVGRQAQPDGHGDRLGQPVVRGVHRAEGRVQRRKAPLPAPVVLLRQRDDAQPEGHRLLGRGGRLAGSVRRWARQAVVDEQPPLVAEGDAVPAARLANDGALGRIAPGDVARPARGGGLLLHGADDADAHPRPGAQPRCGHDHGGQRPLGVHRSPTVEERPVAAHRHLARHRIQVAEEHDLPRPVAEVAHGVAGAIPLRRKS